MAQHYLATWGVSVEAGDFKLKYEKLYCLYGDLNPQPLGHESSALPTELWGKSITQWKIELFSKYFCNYVTNLCQNREGVAQVVIYSGH